MTLAVLASRALVGLDAPAVRVETHVGSGLPAFHVVGLPEAEVRESRERVRAALVNSGYEFPAGRITVNLSPADLPKNEPASAGLAAEMPQVAFRNAEGRSQCWNYGSFRR